MMSKKSKIVVCALLALVVIGASAYAFSSYGSKDDPLITKSYLDDVLAPQLLEEFEARLDASDSAANGSFSVVTLSYGQELTADVGCEIMLRIGSATVSATDTPGLVDTTDGTTLENGLSLTQNHLYMATIAGHSVVAASDTVKLLVSGTYSLQ